MPFEDPVARGYLLSHKLDLAGRIELPSTANQAADLPLADARIKTGLGGRLRPDDLLAPNQADYQLSHT